MCSFGALLFSLRCVYSFRVFTERTRRKWFKVTSCKKFRVWHKSATFWLFLRQEWDTLPLFWVKCQIRRVGSGRITPPNQNHTGRKHCSAQLSFSVCVRGGKSRHRVWHVLVVFLDALMASMRTKRHRNTGRTLNNHWNWTHPSISVVPAYAATVFYFFFFSLYLFGIFFLFFPFFWGAYF